MNEVLVSFGMSTVNVSFMQENTGKAGAKERIVQELTSAIVKANKANQFDIEQFASARKWLQKVPLARARF